MRLIACIVTIVCTACLAPAQAQGWSKYTFSAYGFSMAFPAEPQTEMTTYAAADGRLVEAHVFSLSRGNSTLRITVAELAGAPVEDTSAIEHAARELARGSAVRFDIPHHIGAVYGRQLSIDRPDGSRSFVAIFYRKWRLYQIEGIAPSGDQAALTDAIRFQQSLEFLQSPDFADTMVGPAGRSREGAPRRG
jgi:hypothetical protein